ncbi:putative transmembrane protein [Xylariaceae sp. FL0016]|nr:putative transmembrane protein [Xylariaceae sp. FL0016]
MASRTIRTLVALLVGPVILGPTASFLPEAASVFVPPKPTEVANSTAYLVQARTAGASSESWQTVPLYQINVEEINSTTGSAKTHTSSVGYLNFDGGVDLVVTPDTTSYQDISAAVVRPLSYGVQTAITNREISFTLTQPQNNIVLELNGDIFNVLHLWSDIIEPDPITPAQAANNSAIIYYGEGYHTLDEDFVSVGSGQTLYLAPGAVLAGSIYIQNVSSVTVRGRGILYKPSYGAILIENSKDVTVEGISVLSPGAYSITAGSSKEITVSGFRSVSAVTWGDGLDFFCCQDVLVERAFLRTSDDSIALYQHRNEYYGNSSNITIRDSSLWADVAHPINIGTHGNPGDPETMDGVTFQNIDILDQHEPQIDYQGCIAFTVGDENLIQNVLFDDIRVEDFRLGMLLSMRVVYNTKYNTAPGRGISNVTIKNLDYNGSGENTAIMSGYSDDRSIDFVDFQNLTINGLHIWDDMQKPSWYLTSDYMPMIVANHVNNLTWTS